VPETEGAVAPFFSPDGSWIGYFTRGSVNKVAVSGGTHKRVTDAPPVSRGAHWNAGSTILFNPNKTAGLAEVSDEGGPYEMMTQPDVEGYAGGHCWPQLLPGIRTAVVTILPPGAPSFDEAHIAAIDLSSGEHTVVIEGGSHARYVASGHLVFARRGALLAAPFDLDRLEVTSSPVPVIENVLSDPTSGVAHFAVSETGTLVYAPGGQRMSMPRSLVLVDRDGTSEPVAVEPAGYAWPRYSPDGRELAVVIEGSTDDIWVLDLKRNAMRRLTFEGRSVLPVWASDGRSITYSSVRADMPALYSVAVDGSGEPRYLVGGETPSFACSWSPDGDLLAYSTAREGTTDIYLLTRDGSQRPFLATRFNETGAQFSPDGRWLAYMSDESGRFEVYLRRFPDSGAKWQVSTAGGRGPLWAPDGREISFQAGDTIFAVAVETEPELRIGAPEMVLDEPIATALPNFANYDLSPDGRRFVVVRDVVPEFSIHRLVVVLNWFEELERLAPTE
jgi:serine/threonine-protein kinase